MAFSDDQIKTIVLAVRLVDEKQLNEIITYAQNSGRTLQDALIDRGVVSDQQLGELIAKTSEVPFTILTIQQIPEEMLTVIPQRLARKYHLVAFARGPEGVSIATSDPTQTDIFKQIERKTGQTVKVFYATPRDIERALAIYKQDLQQTVDALLKEDVGPTGLQDPPVARIVDALISSAYYNKASDIHIEPQEKNAIVRFRIDGILQDVLTISNTLHDRIVTRIKVLSNLRTDEHLSAQDGKLQMHFEEETLDIRVSIIPIADGEKIVMRLLSSKSREYSLVDLGMSPDDLTKVKRAYSRSFGMILSTGPTGSGKTTSIYAMLKTLNKRDLNITTIEDPIEYRIKGANQIQVNEKTGLTFANGLRSILRQDPNVIFVGEIRDNETAGIAINAALTGHLVFSTLHTNDAATAIPRLIDMKVEPFLVASTVNIIIAQRLVRRICNTCRTSLTISEEDLLKSFSHESLDKAFPSLRELKQVKIFHGPGCRACRFTGYIGRLGLFEVLEITQKVRELISRREPADEIERAAISEGMNTILEDGLDKVAKGQTTIEEVLRVTRTEMI